MNDDPVFVPGEVVVATGDYCHLLVQGREYTVVGYEPPVVLPHFTYPAYVTVDVEGRKVTGHTYRFRRKT